MWKMRKSIWHAFITFIEWLADTGLTLNIRCAKSTTIKCAYSAHMMVLQSELQDYQKVVLYCRYMNHMNHMKKDAGRPLLPHWSVHCSTVWQKVPEKPGVHWHDAGTSGR